MTDRRREPMHRNRLTIVLASLVFLALGPRSGAAQREAPAPSPEGLWQGAIVYQPGRAEVDIFVELAPLPDGRWTGTIDVLPHGLQYQPLDEVSVQGSQVSFLYVRESPTAGRLESPFTGELSADGDSIRGEFVEGRQNHHTFVLERIGEAGDPRPDPRAAEILPLSESAEELRAAFNRDREAVRVVLLLSPT